MYAILTVEDVAEHDGRNLADDTMTFSVKADAAHSQVTFVMSGNRACSPSSRGAAPNPRSPIPALHCWQSAPWHFGYTCASPGERLNSRGIRGRARVWEWGGGDIKLTYAWWKTVSASVMEADCMITRLTPQKYATVHDMYQRFPWPPGVKQAVLAC